MMWPTMRRTVAIAFVVQGHDYGLSRIRCFVLKLKVSGPYDFTQFMQSAKRGSQK